MWINLQSNASMDRNLTVQSDVRFLHFGISSIFSLQRLCGTLRVQTWSFLGWHCQDTGWVFLSVQNKDRKLRGELESSSSHPLPSSPLLLWGLESFSGQESHKGRWRELINRDFQVPPLDSVFVGGAQRNPFFFFPRSSLSDSGTDCPRKLCWPHALLGSLAFVLFIAVNLHCPLKMQMWWDWAVG